MKKTKKIVSPVIGYDNDVKDQYRCDVWSSFPVSIIEHCINIPECHVLILPSREGLEIPILLNMGIQENKIIAIDASPAEIAVSSWRKKYPEVKFYGKKLSEVGKKLKENNQRIIAANLDMCNNFSHELISELSLFFKTVPVYADFCFCITMAKGRESTETNTLLDLLVNKFHGIKLSEKRLSALIALLKEENSFMFYSIMLLNEGKYISHKTPMAWASFRLFVNSEAISQLFIDNELVKNTIKLANDVLKIDNERYKNKNYQQENLIARKLLNESKHNVDDYLVLSYMNLSYIDIYGYENGRIVCEAYHLPNRRL